MQQVQHVVLRDDMDLNLESRKDVMDLNETTEIAPSLGVQGQQKGGTQPEKRSPGLESAGAIVG